MVQWLRISPAVQGMWVRSLVGELRSYMMQGNQAHQLQLEKTVLHNEEPPCSTKTQRCQKKAYRIQKTICRMRER